VRRVAAASMAGMVIRALRPAGDDKEPRSQLFWGRKNATFVRSGTNTARAPSRCGAENHRAANPQPLRADKALMPDLSSLLGIVGGAVLAIYLVRYYREHYTRAGWLRSGQEASHRLHRA